MFKRFFFFFAFLISFAHAQGTSSLPLAAFNGNYDEVKNLLDQGADPNVKDYTYYSEGFDALFYASWHGHLHIVNLLLDKGANVNAVSADGNHAFTTAASWDHYEIAKMLLDRGANINIRNNLGQSFMLFAAANSPRITQLLLEHGAHHSPRDINGYTPIFEAIPDYNRDDQGHRLESLNLLLNAGADINDQENQMRFTILIQAVVNEQVKSVSMLLERGAHKFLKDIHQKSACDYAQEFNNAEIIEILGTCQK